MTKHAKNYPPSSAARYLSCPGSVTVVGLYPNDESDASLKGDAAHDLLETCMIFGTEPNSDDVDMNENVALVLDWIAEQRRLHAGCMIFSEQRLEIPETGEWGTADIVIDHPKFLHVADYKNGYVVVDVKMNAQMMTYLLGAIAKYGERNRYYITVHQPNSSHIDGPIRTYEVTPEDLAWFRAETAYAVSNRNFAAGKHCKKSYCPHRGACTTFLQWAVDNAEHAWFPSEVNGLTDEQLTKALDHAEILQGLRDELRKEAMRRILNMDRSLEGYKMVKGRQDRAFVDEAPVKAKLIEMGASEDDMYDKKFTSVAGVERFVKKYSKNLGRGAWKKVWENTFKPLSREFIGGLTLERATDGRPAHKRGSEFGPLASPGETGNTDGKVTII